MASRQAFVEIRISGELFVADPSKPFLYNTPKPVLLNVSSIKSVEPNHTAERTYIQLVGKDNRILMTTESYWEVQEKVNRAVGGKLVTVTEVANVR